jgi:uncharacterized protein YutE (UPF0331/DUF86 family)
MERKRKDRYFEKINFLLKRNGQIKEWALEYENIEKERSEKTLLAIYKAFQESIEGCLDIVAMMCRDSDLIVKDDYTNIERVIEDGDIRDILIRANGLRNRIIHLYNKTDEILALEGMKELLPGIEKFGEKAKEWIKKK